MQSRLAEATATAATALEVVIEVEAVYEAEAVEEDKRLQWKSLQALQPAGRAVDISSEEQRELRSVL